MKWTPEGKKIGDTIAFRSWGDDVRLMKIDGETKTLWKTEGYSIRKRDGSCVGWSRLAAFDADEEAMRVIRDQEVAADTRRKHLAIANWVDKTRGAEVVKLLWDLVGPKIERDETE